MITGNERVNPSFFVEAEAPAELGFTIRQYIEVHAMAKMVTLTGNPTTVANKAKVYADALIKSWNSSC